MRNSKEQFSFWKIPWAVLIAGILGILYVFLFENFDLLFAYDHSFLVYIIAFVFLLLICQFFPRLRHRRYFSFSLALFYSLLVLSFFTVFDSELIAKTKLDSGVYTFTQDFYCKEKENVFSKESKVSSAFAAFIDIKNENKVEGLSEKLKKKEEPPVKKKKKTVPPPCLERQIKNSLNPSEQDDLPIKEPWISFIVRKAKYSYYRLKNGLYSFSFLDWLSYQTKSIIKVPIIVEHNALRDVSPILIIGFDQTLASNAESIEKELSFLFFSNSSYSLSKFNKKNTAFINVSSCKDLKRSESFLKIEETKEKTCRIENEYQKFLTSLPIKYQIEYLNYNKLDEFDLAAELERNAYCPKKVLIYCLSASESSADSILISYPKEETPFLSFYEKTSIFFQRERQDLYILNRIKPDRLKVLATAISKNDFFSTYKREDIPKKEIESITDLFNIHGEFGIIKDDKYKNKFTNPALTLQPALKNFRKIMWSQYE